MTNISELFKTFQLKIQIECLVWDTRELISLKIGNFFNLEGNYIAKDIEKIFFSATDRKSPDCKSLIFVNVKKFFKPDFVRIIYNRIKKIEEQIKS